MLPDVPIEYVLTAERDDPAAPRWVLTPQPWKAVLRRSERHAGEKARVAHDPAALDALTYAHALERFADCVAGLLQPDGTRVEGKDRLLALADRLDLDAFGELMHAAQSEPALKAGAKNWPGSSSSGSDTPPMQEPPVSATP